MNIKTCSYIELGDLANIGPEAREALNAFYQYDNHEVTWGSANRTMIDIPTFLDMLFSAVESADLLNGDGHHVGYQDIEKALDEYRKNVYIDLEN
jgi:hypothetical protein